MFKEVSGFLFLSSLMGFFSTEFKILGMAFNDALKKVNETSNEKHLMQIERSLKWNVQQHAKLFWYKKNVNNKKMI